LLISGQELQFEKQSTKQLELQQQQQLSTTSSLLSSLSHDLSSKFELRISETVNKIIQEREDRLKN
jgi:hypothetical protein